jgi:multisubunit Na+/H+ antiporter MnhB subunit
VSGRPADSRSPRASASIHARVAAAVVLGWLGLFLHNRVEFPDLALWRPEYSVATVTWLVLYLAWLLRPVEAWPRTLLVGWGILCLAGAILTVLPLPILPFRPEQSLRHYAVHAVYAATQVPVLLLLR